MPRGGAYRHKITIQQVTEAKDGFGQMVKSWATFAQPFAAVEALAGSEPFLSDAPTSIVSTRIRMRYQSGVTAKMRVSYDGRIYNIENIIDKSERNKELHLMCSEGKNNG